jgi:hypothetical protein
VKAKDMPRKPPERFGIPLEASFRWYFLLGILAAVFTTIVALVVLGVIVVAGIVAGWSTNAMSLIFSVVWLILYLPMLYLNYILWVRGRSFI